MRNPILLFFTLSGLYFVMCSTSMPNDSGHQARKMYFYSENIKRNTYFLVYVPQKIDEPAPVLYLLNGGSQEPYGWQTGADLQNGADSYEMISVSIASVAYPYRDVPGTDVLYESYVLEIIDIVDSLFDTKTSRFSRGIGGYSMGAVGALYVGSRHPELFISVSAMSGSFYDEYPPVWDNFRDQVILFDCGRDDSNIERSRYLHQLLLNMNIPHFFNEYPGGHTYGYMSQHYDEHLNFHSQAFKLGN